MNGHHPKQNQLCESQSAVRHRQASARLDSCHNRPPPNLRCTPPPSLRWWWGGGGRELLALLVPFLQQLLGLEAYNQSFRVDWPYGGVQGRTCTNIHAILRCAPAPDHVAAVLACLPEACTQQNCAASLGGPVGPAACPFAPHSGVRLTQVNHPFSMHSRPVLHQHAHAALP